jgi:hypothetical protein
MAGPRLALGPMHVITVGDERNNDSRTIIETVLSTEWVGGTSLKSGWYSNK